MSELLRQVPQDANKILKGPLLVHGMWRGKDAWLAGYEYMRVSANLTKGTVFEVVMGHGPTPERAIEMMASQIALRD